jgi:hypothetical protein
MKKLSVDDLNTLLGSLHSRRNFMKLLGKMTAYSTLASTLSACGGGGGGSDSGAASGTNHPAAVIPAASGEYSTLKRTSFGAHRDELAMIHSMGIDAYLERQLDPAGIDDGNLETTLQTLFPLTTQSPVQLITGFPDNIADVALQMISAAQYRQIFSKRQLYEVMVEFWSDHFNIHLVNAG